MKVLDFVQFDGGGGRVTLHLSGYQAITPAFIDQMLLGATGLCAARPGHRPNSTGHDLNNPAHKWIRMAKNLPGAA